MGEEESLMCFKYEWSKAHYHFGINVENGWRRMIFVRRLHKIPVEERELFSEDFAFSHKLTQKIKYLAPFTPVMEESILGNRCQVNQPVGFTSIREATTSCNFQYAEDLRKNLTPKI
ncbi:uncharacterized protein LOC128929921 [Callithrix jacchus]